MLQVVTLTFWRESEDQDGIPIPVSHESVSNKIAESPIHIGPAATQHAADLRSRNTFVQVKNVQDV
jgi:hypothetical protein